MVLPDLLKKHLLVVICGTSVSNRSAELGFYYAGVGNRFWQVLHEVGLTSIRLRPENYRDLLDFRIGLTDLVKKRFGSDENLSLLDFDVKSFKQKILGFRPKIVCFNGKRAGQVILDKRKIEYGYQEERIGTARLFVAPSTSGNARRWWNQGWWQELSNSIRCPNVT